MSLIESPRKSACSLLLAAAGLLSLGLSAASAGPKSEDGIAFFENRVRPTFADNCFKCHGGKKQKAGLRLDTVSGIRTGGERGALFDREDPASSLLLRAISYEDEELEMPPRGKLADELIEDLTHWVELGAPLPEEALDEEAHGDDATGFDLAERAKDWTYQPLANAPTPTVRDAAWPIRSLDSFVLAKLEENELSPAPPADRRTWIRRVTLDLTGLPPTPEEVRAFLDDDRPDNARPGADERVVDRLLASPTFGERWGRHWLDLTRYADTRGHEYDFPLPNAYQYRDYVIRAFNADVPYDRFVREHIAGDLLETPRPNPEAGFDESPLATGFWFFGDEVHSPVDTRADELDRLAGKIDTVSKAFLGLTVACARCHDHKFDAITTEDYYSLLGYPLSSSYRQIRFETIEDNTVLARELEAIHDTRGPELVEVAATSYPARAEGSGAYMLAAREVLRTTTWAVGPVARARGFDGQRLGAWVRALQHALGNESDPLQPFALLTEGDDRTPDDRDLGLHPSVAPGIEARAMVVDYSDPKTALIQNGFAYAWRRAGDVRVGSDERSFLNEIAPLDAVYFERAWHVLESHPEAEEEPGVVSWAQAGCTLRTPTFTVEHAKLGYLVRGAGHAHASVDSHRMIHGPLHGALVRSWPEGDTFRWVIHDLRDYVGHRTHVEFAPASTEGAGFAIAAVVAFDTVPPPYASERSWIRRRLGDGGRGIEDLASAYEASFVEALSSFENLPASAVELDPGRARLANWLLARPELLAPPALAGESRAQVTQALAEREECLEGVRPVSRLAPALLEGTGVDEHVLIRGSHHSPGGLAERRFLEVFAGAEHSTPGGGSGRLGLADRIAASPLAWRVIVNRIWHHLFGRGIVASVDDFGRMGERPSHPELLDHLARRFAEEHGFRIKSFVRELVLSRTYRMSCEADAQSLERDPTNTYLHYMPLRRLTAESIRDTILAVSGTLELDGGGPSIPLHLTEFMEGRGRPGRSGPLDGDGKRSVYLSVRRNFPMPFFAVFDFPAPASPIGRRSVSNVPAQALTMMNDPFVWQQAGRFANRILGSADTDPDRVRLVYETAFARPPEAVELETALAFLETQGAAYPEKLRERFAWRDLCHVLYNTKEFLFVR